MASGCSSDVAPPVVRIDPVNPDPEVVARAAGLLDRGEVVAFPTDTIYGLHVDPFDADALARLKDLKGHASPRGYVVLTDGSPHWRDALVGDAGPVARAAMKRWPACLTVVMRAAPGAPPGALAGDGTIAVRHADDPLVAAVLAELGRPLVSTSANRQGRAPIGEAWAVAETFFEGVSLVLDGGPRHGVASTVVDATGPELRVLRAGAVRFD